MNRSRYSVRKPFDADLAAVSAEIMKLLQEVHS
jgi:hypothetical protein